LHRSPALVADPYPHGAPRFAWLPARDAARPRVFARGPSPSRPPPGYWSTSLNRGSFVIDPPQRSSSLLYPGRPPGPAGEWSAAEAAAPLSWRADDHWGRIGDPPMWPAPKP